MTIWAFSGRQVTIPDAAYRGVEIRFYDADTPNILSVFKDAGFTAPHAVPIKVDSWGRIPNVFVKPTGRTYRATLTYPDGNSTEYGPFDSGSAESAASAFAAPILTAEAKTGTAVTVKASDFGKILELVVADGEVPVTLPPSNQVTSGALLGVRNTHGGGAIKVRGTGTELIDGRRTIPITGKNLAKIFVATTGGYLVIAEHAPVPRVWTVKSRASNDPPVGAAAGECYLAPVGANVPWAPDTIYMSDGDGGWIDYVPEIGWQCTVENESDSTQFTRSGNTTSGSATVSMADTSKLYVGMPVTGEGIPADTTVSTVESGSVMLSANATATAAGVVLTLGNATASLPRALIYTTSGWVEIASFYQTAIAEGLNA
mgnify:CR=1 FL=1